MTSFRETTRIGKAFSIMMKEHVHLALVRDSKGVILGMITLEDILEEVVGDIQDEFDRLPRYITKMGDRYLAGGGVEINKVFNILDLKDNENIRNMSLNEWVKSHYSDKLKGGDAVNINGINIHIRKIRHNHIIEAVVYT